MTDTLVMERDLPHPPEKVWRALTRPELMAEWLLKNDFAPKTGHKFNFRTDPVAHWNGVVDSEVLELEPDRKLVYSWIVGEMKTVVSWTLTATATGTHLRMEHSGFRPDQQNNLRGAQYGWKGFLTKLDRVVAAL